MKKNLVIGLIFACLVILLEQVSDVLLATEISRYDLITLGSLTFDKSEGIHSLISFVIKDTTSVIYLVVFALICALVLSLAILFTAKRKNVLAIGLFVVFGGLGCNLIDMIVNESHEVISYIYYTLPSGDLLWINIAQVFMVLGLIVAIVGLFIKAKKTNKVIVNA